MVRSSPSNDCDRLKLITCDDGRYLLLDIEGDRVLAMNPVAAEIWNLLSEGETEPQIVTTISKKYRVDEQQARNDTRCLLGRISELQLAPPKASTPEFPEAKRYEKSKLSYPWYGGAGVQRPRPKTVTVLAAIFGLAIFDLILLFSSLKSLCSCVNAWPLWKRRGTPPNISAQVCAAMEHACIWYPKKVMCLQRSAVTACMLRSYGIPSRMVIGFRPAPFLAHAWVEVDGAVINDWRQVTGFYRPVVSY